MSKQKAIQRKFPQAAFISGINYLTSVKTTRLRSFGEYFFSCSFSGVLRLFLEVR